MDKLKKTRFIDQKTIVLIDRIMLILSLGYLFLYFQHGGSVGLFAVSYIIFIHICNVFSKTKANSLLSAFGYSLTLFAVIYQYYPVAEEMRLLFFAPFVLFFIILLSNFSSTLLTGILLGYWILVFYVAFKNGWTGINSVLTSYLNYSYILNHFYFLLLTALITSLFFKTQSYTQITRTMKMMKTLVWLGVPFVLVAVNGPYPVETIKVAGFYVLLVSVMHYSLIKNNSMMSSIAYAITALVTCILISRHFGIENFYFILLIPLLVILLVNYFKIDVRFLIGFLVSYWLILLIALYRGLEYGIISRLEMLLSYNGIFSTLDLLWLPFLIGLVWARMSSLTDSLIHRLEDLNRKIKQRQSAPAEHELADSNTKGWEEL